MATEKLLNTRIQLKYDSYTNWNSAAGKAVVLKAGEIGICAIPSGATAVNGDPVRPQILMKVGDGTTTFENLKWVSAIAADVYDWAKQSEADFVANFLAMEDSDGVAMQTKLDNLFATPNEVNAAVTALKNELTGDTGIAGLASRVKAIEDDYLKAADITGKADKATTLAGYGIGDAYTKTEVDGKLDAKANSADLGTAAAKNIEFFATAAQGTKADSAVQSVTVLGETLSNGGELTVEEAKTALGLSSAAYEDKSAFDAAGAAATAKSEAISEAASDAQSKYATIKAAEDAQAAADSANAKIDAFMADDAAVEGAIDTLKEINKYITDDTEAFTQLSNRVTALEDGTEPAAKAEHAETASGLDATGIAQVKGIKVDSAAAADVAAKASGLDDAGVAAVKAVKVDNATNADDAAKLGGVAAASYALKTEVQAVADDLSDYETAHASDYTNTQIDTKVSEAVADLNIADYVKKSEAPGYNDILTKTEAAQNYATAAQGALADSALQKADIVTGTNNGTIKVEGSEVAVAGLKSAAYTESSAYATSAQGAKADSAVQSVTAVGGSGLKATTSNNAVTLDIDPDVVFVLNGGSASVNI